MLFSHICCSTRALRFNPDVTFRQFTNTARKWKVASKQPVSIPATTRSGPARGRPEQIQALAAKMFQAGRDEIYRNTSSRAYVGVSFSIMLVSYSGIGYLYSTRLWDSDVTRSRGLQWFVPVGYQATMICWGIVAAYAFSRTLGLVNSIKLVKEGQKVLVETTIRRPIPFMRAEKHLSEPSDMIVNRAKLYTAAFSEDMITAPEGNTFLSRLTRTLFYTPFHNTRKALGGVGLVPIQVGPIGNQRHAMIDADGKFSNGGKDLLDLSMDEI